MIEEGGKMIEELEAENEELDRQMGLIIIKLRQDHELAIKNNELYKNQTM